LAGAPGLPLVHHQIDGAGIHQYWLSSSQAHTIAEAHLSKWS
jgi:hypothetical protein